ncbi:MAG: hypothetical protein SFW67_03435 [Myxococcaceae bacterium]|nr:hypothetical protein [Myxococcaceae bacterium]
MVPLARVVPLVALLSLNAFAQGFRDPSPESAPPERKSRLRAGFTVGAGSVFGNFNNFILSAGAIFNVSARLGIQIGKPFALMLQTMPNLYVLVPPGGATATGVGINNAILAELTLGDRLQLGAGPSIDYLGGAGCNSTGCYSAEGVGFGGHFRAALVLGDRNPRNGRRGLSLAVNAHPIFLPNRTLFVATFGVGAEWF